MWTGRQTLGEIESALTKLRQEEGQLDTALNSATSEAEALRRDRAQAYRELARIKLGEISSGRLVRNLDAAEQQAVRILENRRLRIETLNQQRKVTIAEVQQAEKDRNGAAAAVETAVDAVDTIRANAEKTVRTTAAWTDAQKAYDAADSVASEAEKKAAQSESELTSKRKPYDEDRLFSYLWQRNFGTAQYTANNFVRYMDRMVADFIGFADARANYAMLKEIPVRLREHATRQRQNAEDLKATLAAVERRAMVEAGIEPKESELAETRHRLATADAVAEKKRGLLRDLETTVAALVDGTGDQAYADALQTIADADTQDDIRTLYAEARRTETMSDDMIVQRIGALDERMTKLQQDIGSLRDTAQNLARRRVDVEQVRDRFRSAGYDHPNATFNNDSEIGVILGQVLEGVVRSGILWDVLRGGFGTRTPRGRPDFGAPTFPFPFPMPGGGEGARGGEWRQPNTRGGWTSPFPDSSRGSDDSFSTGGSF
jgi:hypothetical protein